jgi:hypothetical protein
LKLHVLSEIILKDLQLYMGDTLALLDLWCSLQKESSAGEWARWKGDDNSDRKGTEDNHGDGAGKGDSDVANGVPALLWEEGEPRIMRTKGDYVARIGNWTDSGRGGQI